MLSLDSKSEGGVISGVHYQPPHILGMTTWEFPLETETLKNFWHIYIYI